MCAYTLLRNVRSNLAQSKFERKEKAAWQNGKLIFSKDKNKFSVMSSNYFPKIKSVIQRGFTPLPHIKASLITKNVIVTLYQAFKRRKMILSPIVYTVREKFRFIFTQGRNFDQVHFSKKMDTFQEIFLRLNPFHLKQYNKHLRKLH